MNELEWDTQLQRLSGHLLQSWRWGVFKERQGWIVHRLGDAGLHGTWMAQIMFKSGGPFTIAYIPCGPVLTGDHSNLFARMMNELDALCGQQRSVTLIMEPNQRFQLQSTFKQHGFVQWRNPFQPRTTISIPVQDDQSMLNGMHHKTRYHIRLAQRQGVVLETRRANQESIDLFTALHSETVDRNKLTLLPPQYFTDLLEVFDDKAALLFAMVDHRPAAAALMVRFGNEASYLFAGSSKHVRGQGAGAFLVFGALQWARANSCRHVDLGNMGPEGLRVFKSGFGGAIHAYPTAMERRYHPLLAFGVRRMLTTRRI